MNALPPLRNLISRHVPKTAAIEFLKFVGPGLLVTVGFIDPGNWASNIAAGSQFGYNLLWTISLGTVMLIFLQHNAAHLGIATGLCLAEACNRYYSAWLSWGLLLTALCGVVATAFAEVLGAAIGLNMLLGLPLPLGAGITVLTVLFVLLSSSYQRLEKWIIAFVSLIGLSFLFELSLTEVGWGTVAASWVKPSFPSGSLPIVMSVLGAVVMPHNLFLHSEVIQSRQWNLKDEQTIRRQLKFEFADTLLAMGIGWLINSAMIVVAAAVFFSHGTTVTELQQAEATMKPLLGNAAASVFALGLVGAGFASTATAGVAAGSVFAGITGRSLDLSESHSRMGVFIALAGAFALTLVVRDAYSGLIWSQVALSIQLPFTVFSLIFLTSSRKVMGRFANRAWDKVTLGAIAAIVSLFNIVLLLQFFWPGR